LANIDGAANGILADLASMQFKIVTLEAAAASVLPPVTSHV
jgi:hypothetical protein